MLTRNLVPGPVAQEIPPLLDRVRQWQYQSRGRDLRLDLLRGFAAFAMVVDHVGGANSWLFAITGGNQFFVSAAEPFVLISGIVLGIVYRPFVASRGIAAGLMKALHRAWMLYVLTVMLALTFAGLGSLLGLGWAPDLGVGGVGRFVLDVATLHRTVYLADILLMYALLLLIAVPVVLLLSQQHTIVVLVGSWLVWALWQFAPGSSSVLWEIRGNDVFNLSAWQVIFVNGVVIGWHRQSIESWVAHRAAGAVRWAVAIVCVAVVALYVAQLTSLDALRANRVLAVLVFDKPDLAIGRLVVFALFSIASFEVTTLLWRPIHLAVGWLLLPLGQHALTAYSIHLFVVVLTALLGATILVDALQTPVVAAALQLGAVAVVWLVVRFEAPLHGVVRRMSSSAAWESLASAGALGGTSVVVDRGRSADADAPILER